MKHLNYTYQEDNGGIAEALGLAEYFAAGLQICVILGGSIIENNICHTLENSRKENVGATILLKEADDAQRFGVAEVRDNRILNIAEKPNPAKSNYVVPGIYLYNSTVFQKIKCLNSSGREELEITDVHSFYSEEDKLTYEMLHGWWTDAGTFKSLPRANNLVA